MLPKRQYFFITLLIVFVWFLVSTPKFAFADYSCAYREYGTSTDCSTGALPDAYYCHSIDQDQSCTQGAVSGTSYRVDCVFCPAGCDFDSGRCKTPTPPPTVCPADTTCISHPITWGACSVSCGGGWRTGTCDDGCGGTGSTEQQCNIQPCTTPAPTPVPTTAPTPAPGECDSNCSWNDIVDQCGPIGICGYCQVRTRIYRCDGNGDGTYTNCQDECSTSSSLLSTLGCRNSGGSLCVAAPTPTPTPTPAPSGSISASPNPCDTTTDRCSSTISWGSTNTTSAQVWVSDTIAGGGAWYRFDPSGAVSGSKEAPNIFVPASSHSYTFNLYNCSSGCNGVNGGSAPTSGYLAGIVVTGNDTGVPACTSLTTNASRLGNGGSLSMTATGTDNVSVKWIDVVMSSNTSVPWSMFLLCRDQNLSGLTASLVCLWTVDAIEGSHKLGFNIADSSSRSTNYSSSANCQNDLCVDLTAPISAATTVTCTAASGTVSETPACSANTNINYVKYTVKRSSDNLFWQGGTSWAAGGALQLGVVNKVNGTWTSAGGGGMPASDQCPVVGCYYTVTPWTDDGINTGSGTAKDSPICNTSTPTPTPTATPIVPTALSCSLMPASTKVVTKNTISYSVNTSGGSENFSYVMGEGDCPLFSCGGTVNSTNSRNFTYTAVDTTGQGLLGCVMRQKVKDLTTGTGCCAEGTFDISDFNITAQ